MHPLVESIAETWEELKTPLHRLIDEEEGPTPRAASQHRIGYRDNRTSFRDAPVGTPFGADRLDTDSSRCTHPDRVGGSRFPGKQLVIGQLDIGVFETGLLNIHSR